MNIAYVEDNPTNIALVERLLRLGNHSLITFNDGESALAALPAEAVDLILVDVELGSEMTGIELVRALRAAGLTTPMVAVTAYAMLGDREKTLEAGCNSYLSKPIVIPEFLAMLKQYTPA
jgi:two-component system cell cycle response regulator DivK